MATATFSDMSFWIKFFKDAGIPAGDAANYAVKFSDNRITRSMLMDLTKDYLSDMGITILGDVISILKHAKSAHSQEVRERVLRENVSGRITPTREIPTPKRSTPASRTIAHHIGSDRSASPTVNMAPVSTKISKSLSARLGIQPAVAVDTTPRESLSTLITLNSGKPKEVVPVPKKRRVFPEHEGKYKITMPAGTTPKTQKILELQRKQAEAERIRAEEKKRAGKGQLKESVFSRLGSEKPKPSKASSTAGPTITITGLNNVNMPAATQSSVFNRLGGKTAVKRAATSTVTFGDDDIDDDEDVGVGNPLEYAGVLKPSASPPKKVKLEAANRIKKMARNTLAAKASTAGLKSEGLFAGKGSNQNVKCRLGAKVAEASSTTQSVPLKAGKNAKEGIQSRLGTSQLDKLTITVDTTSGNSGGGSGIFSRLGKPK